MFSIVLFSIRSDVKVDGGVEQVVDGIFVRFVVVGGSC